MHVINNKCWWPTSNDSLFGQELHLSCTCYVDVLDPQCMETKVDLFNATCLKAEQRVSGKEGDWWTGGAIRVIYQLAAAGSSDQTRLKCICRWVEGNQADQWQVSCVSRCSWKRWRLMTYLVAFSCCHVFGWLAIYVSMPLNRCT